MRPAAVLEGLEAAARRLETPCGAGRMVWRAWGEGPPLVLLHGGSGSWRHWVRQIPAFAATHRVIAADLPGLGSSDMPPAPGEVQDFAAVLAEGLDRLVPDGAFDLAAFSFGATIAGRLATLRRPRRMALLGASAMGTPRVPVDLVKVREKQGEARIAAHRANLAAMMIADPAAVDALALAIAEANMDGSRYRSRGYATSSLLIEALAGLRGVPLACIWGGRDALVLGKLDQRIARLREVRPDAAVHVVPGAGHWVAYEAPEEVNALLSGFLRAA